MKKLIATLTAVIMVLGTMSFAVLADSSVELPAATVTKISAEELELKAAPELTFALKFVAGKATEEQHETYDSWYVDYELTVNKDVVFSADDPEADGYLAGEYGSYGWISVPFGNMNSVVVKANEPIKIMETAAQLLGRSELNVTYADVVAIGEFNCGIFFSEEFLAANPDLDVSLELAMYETVEKKPEDKVVIGETYQFDKTSGIISVEFEETKEDSGIYNINLVADEGNNIHEFASAELTFANTSVNSATGEILPYEITAGNNITLTKDGDDCYMFSMNGIGACEVTAPSITIGQVCFDGYGEIDFTTVSGIVNATTASNNLVDTFVSDGDVTDEVEDGDLLVGGEVADKKGIIDDTRSYPECDLTINVTFPNAIVGNAEAYQAMAVSIVGGDYSEIIGLENFADGADAYQIVRSLPYNTTYTVTVKGEGYRTARYSVTLTENKTLNFWNNVMDNDVEVEEGKTTSAVNTNFLAGDIVGDNNINIYDLSAVVSYFGAVAEDTSAEWGKVKYDLNRDGKIDSKDVAYVLVSWNN